MKKMSRVFLSSLAIVAIVLVPACRSSRKKVPPPSTATTATVPDVAMEPPPSSETSVKPPDDFVNETPRPVEETLPADIEQLNQYVQKRGYLRDAFFNYDESTLDADAQEALSSSASWLKGKDGAGYSLLVEGHCDERGTEQYNLALGDHRANTVKDYLATLGVDASRIRTVSYGEERPFSEGHDESSWKDNRRAHLVLVR